MNGFAVVPYFLTGDLELKPIEALMISMIWSLHNSFNTAIISNRKLADRLGVSVRSVSGHLSNLEKKELIARVENDRGGRTINMDPNLKKRLSDELKKANKSQKPDVAVPWLEDYLKGD